MARTDAFVGRQAELSCLDEQLAAAIRGSPGIVLVEGPPGVGKTALLSRFLRGTSGLRILRATGEEFEAELALGVAEHLFSGVGSAGDGVAAKAGAKCATADVLALGADVVETLRILQGERPVALVVDDAHWADRASLQALTFALRRLRADRVLTVISTRDVLPLPEGLQRLLADEQSIRLRLRGLEVHELRLLADTLGVGPLSRPAAERLHGHTSGNPLHARALFEELPFEFLRDGTLPLPAPRSFAMLVLGRLARCSSEAERLVVAVSVLGGLCRIDLAGRLAELEQPLVALEEAIAALLLEEQPTATETLVSFPHPLMQAAVYRDLGPARRSALHARAGALLGDQLAGLRHRMAAATGREAGLAAEAAASARRHAATGAWSTAADTLAAAARLSPDPADRARLFLEAVDWMLRCGRTAEAIGLEPTLLGLPECAWQSHVLGRLALVVGAHARAEACLFEAWRRCDAAVEPALAARIAAQLACLHLTRGDGRQAEAWARQALAADPATAAAEHVTDVLLLSRGISGRTDEMVVRSAALSDENGDLDRAPLDGRVGRGVLRLWSGDTRGSRRDLAAALAAGEHEDRPVHLHLLGLCALSDAEYRLGEWDHSLAHSALAVTRAEDAEQRWLLAQLHAVSAFPRVGRGEWGNAEFHVRAAAAAAGMVGDTRSVSYAATARALLAATRDDPPGVVAAVDPLLGLKELDGVDAPTIVPWREMYVDALIGLGRHAEAERELVSYDAQVRDRGGPTPRATAGRLRGNLEAARGRPAVAEAAFREGLDAAATCGQPLDRARLELAYGGLLRRRGRRAEAAGYLSRAQERLASLGARPHLERCARELRACGAVRARRDGRAGPRLTSQEQAVASLVAAGYSNREAARELVLSVKTVEFHLGNVFSKIGVRSRSQLVLRLPKPGDRT